MNLLTSLSAESSAFLFPGKYADIVALNSGNKDYLRSTLSANNQARKLKKETERQIALIIGGNGFVGAHLVARLSLETRIKKVFVTVRASQEKSPEERLT